MTGIKEEWVFIKCEVFVYKGESNNGEISKRQFYNIVI